MSSPEKIDALGPQPVNGLPKDHSIGLESMIVLVHSDNLKKLEKKMLEKFPELKEQQEDIQLYHLVEMKINTELDPKGELEGGKFDEIISGLHADFQRKLDQNLEKTEDPEQREKLLKRFEQRKEMLNEIAAMGTKIKNGATKFTSDQKVRFCSNLKTQADDLKVHADLAMQQMSTLINHTHESHQFARTMLKTLDDMKKGPARAMGGR